MNAEAVMQNAVKLLGYGDENGNAKLTEAIKSRAVPIINLVYSELCRCVGSKFEPISSLAEEIKLPERVLTEVMPTGLAMYIAQSEGDSANENFWSQEYSMKLLTLTRKERIVPKI